MGDLDFIFLALCKLRQWLIRSGALVIEGELRLLSESMLCHVCVCVCVCVWLCETSTSVSCALSTFNAAFKKTFAVHLHCNSAHAIALYFSPSFFFLCSFNAEGKDRMRKEKENTHVALPFSLPSLLLLPPTRPTAQILEAQKDVRLKAMQAQEFFK